MMTAKTILPELYVCVLKVFLLIFLLTSFSIHVIAQATPLKDSSGYVKLKASDKYNKSSLYRFLWGTHYRKEWRTPVSFKIAMLDTLAGGLTAYEKGGGRQSKSLRLRDANQKEYVLRSIDKSFGKALPDIAQGTILERFVDDQVTIGHPYSALTIAPMAEAAKIYHTNPRIYYIPKQKALGEFSDDIGDQLYLFEQRPDENWEEAANFGNAKKIIGTDKMLEKLQEDNDNSVDQLAFVRARLFDILIGDWGRHEDQWRWAVYKDDKETVYKPIPRDRDQAYTKFDGFILKRLIYLSGAKHLQTFDYKIKNIKRFNFPARNLDLRLTNEVSEQQWVEIAKDIQRLITDDVIDKSIKQLPPEVYNISGPEIAAKLKSRRNLLPKYAAIYQRFISHHVEIPGTKKAEYFEIKRLSSDSTEINIYKITKEGKVKNKPFYHRVFDNDVTKEIRIYGLDGNDEYKVTGNVRKSIKIRLIGGLARDKFTDDSRVREPEHQTKIYDDKHNDFKKSKETALRLSSDSSIHAYDYYAFKYEKRSLHPVASYNTPDRLFVGMTFDRVKQQWRKDPFGYFQHIDVKYSITQQALSGSYQSIYTHLIGKWNVNVGGSYDFERWTNFFGLGNETLLTTKDRDYFRMRTRELTAIAGVERIIRNRHKISILPFYHTRDVLKDSSRFIAKQFLPAYPGVYEENHFFGTYIGYVYQHLNDSVLPVKGISMNVHGDFVANLKKNGKDFIRYGAEIKAYLPLTKKFGLVLRDGGSGLNGTPEFYQYNSIGGTETVRGYQRDRFYGNFSFYSQNELRWITNFRSFLFNGKVGLFGLYDIGRVWLNGENSNQWHYGYGGGLIVSPFNKISVSLAYGVSPEDVNLHLNVLKVF